MNKPEIKIMANTRQQDSMTDIVIIMAIACPTERSPLICWSLKPINTHEAYPECPSGADLGLSQKKDWPFELTTSSSRSEIGVGGGFGRVNWRGKSERGGGDELFSRNINSRLLLYYGAKFAHERLGNRQ